MKMHSINDKWTFLKRTAFLEALKRLLRNRTVYLSHCYDARIRKVGTPKTPPICYLLKHTMHGSRVQELMVRVYR